MTTPPADRISVVVPDLGANEQPLSISAWYVEVGDNVSAGDPLLEILLPGITCDVSAPVSGQIVRIEKEIDAAVQVGEVVAWIVRVTDDSDSDLEEPIN
jgi:pyruvate/2-oxoglutarate dehydrogenase complex dihydrolipoamide acyltransferase (E2) component